jgi:hypothetical protein
MATFLTNQFMIELDGVPGTNYVIEVSTNFFN